MRHIQSLDRALKNLDLLSQVPEGIRITEMAAIVVDVGKARSERMSYSH